MWECTKCDEQVTDGFDICWNCGTSVDGVPDPHFQQLVDEVESTPPTTPNLDDCTALPQDADSLREVFDLADTLPPTPNPIEQTTPLVQSPLRETQRTKIGDYEILECIGKGGMGVVYRAKQTSLDRLVALKTIRSVAVSHDDREVMRFRAEAEAVAALKHPGIVPIYQFGQVDGQWFLSMELMEGGTLDSLLWKGPLEPDRAAELMKAIAEAVAAAHAEGVIHRDL